MEKRKLELIIEKLEIEFANNGNGDIYDAMISLKRALRDY